MDSHAQEVVQWLQLVPGKPNITIPVYKKDKRIYVQQCWRLVFNPFSLFYCSGEWDQIITILNQSSLPCTTDLKNSVKGKIVIAERGDCTFIEKARKAQTEGAVAMIVIDNVPDTSAENQPMFAMSGDGTDDVLIPVVFLFSTDGETLKKAIADNPELEVRIITIIN